MFDSGYQKSKFVDPPGDIFDCNFCNKVVKDPNECTGCGTLFCFSCIENARNMGNGCPVGCDSAGIKPMNHPALTQMYIALNLKCQYCSKTFDIKAISNHEDMCNTLKCWNFQNCNNKASSEFKGKNPVCTMRCELFKEIMESNGKVDKLYMAISKFAAKNNPQSPKKTSGQESGQLVWNQQECGTGLQFSDKTHVFLKEQPYIFRTVITKTSFNEGRHYWQIQADSRTENQLKIGVTVKKPSDFNTAFCDHSTGFAYYGLGQLRQGSNANGTQYGQRFKKTGKLGVYLNMQKGTLGFDLDGKSFGIAFTDKALKQGPIYPAVSLLHCAGCAIIKCNNIPAHYNGV